MKASDRGHAAGHERLHSVQYCSALDEDEEEDDLDEDKDGGDEDGDCHDDVVVSGCIAIKTS